MTANPVGGQEAYIGYAYETTFGTAGSPINKVFGENQRPSISARRNRTRIYGTGDRNFRHSVPGKFEGAATIDAVLENGWWLRGLLGSAAVTGSAAVFTHTYNEADTIPSMTIENGIQLSGGDLIRSLKGAFIDAVTLTAALGEPVSVRFDCLYANEGNTNTLMSTYPTGSYDSLTFAGATFNLAGSVIAEMQNIELEMRNNGEMVWGIGSQTPTNFVVKNREYNIRGTVAFKDTTEFYDRTIGAGSIDYTPSADAYLTVKFTNNEAGASEETIQFNLGSIYWDEHTLPQNPDEAIKEDVVAHAMYCGSATYINSGSPAL